MTKGQIMNNNLTTADMKANKYPDEFKMQMQVEEEITLFTAQK